ncbi:DMT family transporter [Pseudorhodoferax sp.]|uniref:DMT family transporter n=1 Tax=Pseudorhodoferax sp. TaxID=1993553 RepID=UPI002DD665DF|nr:DMT family transporter [Pseudorhodoferax sp.]
MPAQPVNPADARRSGWFARRQAALHRRTAHLSPTSRALLWSTASGVAFAVLNALARQLAQELHPMQAQFLRYLFGVLVMLPLFWHGGLASLWPRNVGGQFVRGAVHTVGLLLWFSALPRIPLADMTAIGFTGPLFILIGAWLFLKEPMRWERWAATAAGFAGMLIVLAPALAATRGGAGAWGGHGFWHLVMLASAPVFAASFLLNKALTRTESTAVIVLWQSLTVTLLTLPLALPVWQWPSAGQWLAFAVCGLLGSGGHYCLTRSFRFADISATQSVKFLDLIWAALLGLLLFADVPSGSTLAGGALICAATLWLAHREARRPAVPSSPPTPPRP